MLIPSNLANNNTFNNSMQASNLPSSLSTTILPSLEKEPSGEVTESQTSSGLRKPLESKEQRDLKMFRQHDAPLDQVAVCHGQGIRYCLLVKVPVCQGPVRGGGQTWK